MTAAPHSSPLRPSRRVAAVLTTLATFLVATMVGVTAAPSTASAVADDDWLAS